MNQSIKHAFGGPGPIRRLRWLVIAAAATGIVAACVAVSVMWHAGLFLRGDVAFTPSRWERINPDQRHHLADDFLRNHFVSGVSLEELFGLLGDPDWDRQYWHYWLSDMGAPPSDVMIQAELADYPSLDLNFATGQVSGVEGWFAEPPAQREFDPEKWRSASPADRFGMVVDLIESGVLLNRDAAEVLQLLGAADRQDPHRTITYTLGWNIIDLMMLEFKVDEQGRVVDGALRDG